MLNKILYLLLIITITPSSAYTKQLYKEFIIGQGTQEEQGEKIALEFDQRDIGFKHVIAKMTMVMRNNYNQETTRIMRNQILEVPEITIGDKSLIVFDTPKDVKGTVLLSHAQILKPDNQWLFLPSLKRVKRISSKNKSGPFIGSEFSYEDITGNEIGKYSWKFISLDKCSELECFKLETKPKYEYSGYTKRIVWIDSKHFRLQKIDYYDRKAELLKTQTYEDYKLYKDKFWRAHNWNMVNHQTGKSTNLIFEYYDFDTELNDRDFTTSVLKRIK